MKGRLEVQRSTFRDFGHFGPFLTFLTDDLSPFLIKFWSFLVIFGRFWVDPGSGRVWRDDGGTRQRAAEAWLDLGRGQGPRSGRDQGQILAILASRGQNLRVRVRFLVSGVKIWSGGSKFGRRGQIFGLRDQNLRVGVRCWSILVDFGHFWTPAQNPKILIRAQGPLKKMALGQGILVRIWMGG